MIIHHMTLISVDEKGFQTWACIGYDCPAQIKINPEEKREEILVKPKKGMKVQHIMNLNSEQ